MRKFEVEITRSVFKFVTVTVPDNVSKQDVESWADLHDSEVFDLDYYDGVKTWKVDDMVDGEEFDISLKLTLEDSEFEVDSVTEE